MTETIEERVRNLAQPLWESAARPYGMAVDFWLMAEQMVLEMMSATARMQTIAAETPDLPPDVAGVPLAAPVERVRALARCMWESASLQSDMSEQFWLSAERHVLTMLRAATACSTSGSSAPWIREVADLSPPAYLGRIRSLAYDYWQAAGEGYGHALDHWLQAERDMLVALAKVAERKTGDEPQAGGATASPVEDAAATGTTEVSPSEAGPIKAPVPGSTGSVAAGPVIASPAAKRPRRPARAAKTE